AGSALPTGRHDRWVGMSLDTETRETRDPASQPAGEETTPTARKDTTREKFTILLSFARDDAGRYVLSAALAALGTLCQLGPFYVIYLAIRDIVAGDATLAGMLTLAGAALALIVAHYTVTALSTLVSHRAAFRTLARLRLRIGHRLS